MEPPPSPSCPRSSRASTSFLRHLSKQDVDGRDKPGHDSGEVVQHGQSKFLLPHLPQPRHRLLQCISEAVGLVMRDASHRDQLGVHTGFLKFRNSRLRWVERYDLVVAGMNRQNRKPPPGGGCRRPAGDWNCRAEAFRKLLRKMPGACTAHTVAGDCKLVLVD